MGRVMSGSNLGANNDLMLKYNGVGDYFELPANNGGNNAMGGQLHKYAHLPMVPSHGTMTQHGSTQLKKAGKRGMNLPQKMPQAPPDGFYCYYPEYFEKPNCQIFMVTRMRPSLVQPQEKLADGHLKQTE